MAKYRNNLPQLGGDIYLTDAGIETDLIFNRGIEIREFAAHTLLPNPKGRRALQDYFGGFIDLANRFGTGLILDTVTWKAHRHWADDLGESPSELHEANRIAVALIANLRATANNVKPIVLNAPIGPRGDAYAPEELIDADSAEAYYAEQLGWLTNTEIDMVTGLTFTQASEAVGLVRAARFAELPCVISFTVETDGRLPTGQPLREAIEHVDSETEGSPAYYMINCAHPDHFADVLRDGDWRKRIRGIRANASRCSHAELDEAEVLDPGNPVELGEQYSDLRAAMPWLNVFGGCCGCDVRHVAAIATSLAAMAA
ncbi:homocysteine S-methyltransferase family protein [Qipengyuania sphaerica]|uniref:homocysteine S-methyltransferase family protein n=1 Tax=Qipengyuania sphaerica TaxID=2867243 RepID=UPI001C8A04E1|nr:homocysteine S-methyltransferase family protein [Qipengyuania sphaerica]MBX7542000.1 homocysteine S-methyltransferase family protein [Qipengyuania sphaerica]